ncbi:MAG: nucleotidyltransferase family protein [Verrucomicrobiota bacterium]
MKKTLVILAAGIGRRYGGPKQMDPVGPSGEFIIDYSIYDALRTGFQKIVFVISRKIENDFKSTIGSRISEHVETDYVFQDLDALPDGFAPPPERKKPWGTGHALLVSKSAISGKFAVINADDFYGRQSYTILSNFLDSVEPEASEYAMVGFALNNTVSKHGSVARGICKMDSNGHLADIVERTQVELREKMPGYVDESGQWLPLTGHELVSMNMWGFTPSIFPRLETEFRMFLADCAGEPSEEFFIPLVVDNLIKRQEATVRVLETPCAWTGVTYKDDREIVVARISSLIKAGEYPEKLWGRG